MLANPETIRTAVQRQVLSSGIANQRGHSPAIAKVPMEGSKYAT